MVCNFGSFDEILSSVFKECTKIYESGRNHFLQQCFVQKSNYIDYCSQTPCDLPNLHCIGMRRFNNRTMWYHSCRNAAYIFGCRRMIDYPSLGLDLACFVIWCDVDPLPLALPRRGTATPVPSLWSAEAWKLRKIGWKFISMQSCDVLSRECWYRESVSSSQ